MATHRSRQHRYNRNGEIIPPLPPQPLKERPARAQRVASDLLEIEAKRRETQRRVAALDTLEAGQWLEMLRSIIGAASTLSPSQAGLIIEQSRRLDQVRPSLRRRVVELLRYTARTETELIANVLRNVANDIDNRRHERAAQ